MKLIFAEGAWEDHLYWQKQDRRMIDRINKPIRETQWEPFTGIGIGISKPEPLRHALSDYWSRWIGDGHRMVYKVDADALLIAQLRLRYGWVGPGWSATGHDRLFAPRVSPLVQKLHGIVHRPVGMGKAAAEKFCSPQATPPFA